MHGVQVFVLCRLWRVGPTKRFKDLNRKTFSRLIQLRTGHAHIGEHYRRFVRTEDPTCVCGRETQTRQHVLKECPRHLNQRPLLGTGRNAHLDRLVGTEARIKRLSKFITITKAIDKHRTPSDQKARLPHREEQLVAIQALIQPTSHRNTTKLPLTTPTRPPPRTPTLLSTDILSLTMHDDPFCTPCTPHCQRSHATAG